MFTDYDLPIWLTTSDNHCDPFVDYDAWEAEDRRLGHNTEQKIALVLCDSDEFGPKLKALMLIQALFEIYENDPFGVYEFTDRNKRK